MNSSLTFFSNNNFFPNKLLLILKISIILFTSIILLGSFVPFFNANDGYSYGLTAIGISHGSFTITNDLLKDTGEWEFVPVSWLKTIDNEAINGGMIGLLVIASLFYSIGGIYGLFFLGPVFTILLLISSERITTNLFGKYVGLLVLIFLATNNLIFRFGTNLITDIVFTFFLTLGIFYLIKFLQFKKDKYLFMTSIFLVVSTLVRINGGIFLPAEFIIIGGYFILHHIKQIKKFNDNSSKGVYIKHLFLNFSKKITLKRIFFMTLPWILFLIFWFSFNANFTGDPFTSYFDTSPHAPDWWDKKPSTPFLLDFDMDRFDTFKGYSKFLLPFPLSSIPNHTEKYDDFFGNHWMGIFTIMIIILSLITSFLLKQKRIPIVTFSIFITFHIFVYSSSHVFDPDFLVNRWSVPVFPIFFMLLGFLIHSIFTCKYFEKNNSVKIFYKTLILIGLSGFCITAFFLSPYFDFINDENVTFNDPIKLSSFYPLDNEGLTKNSVIVTVSGSRAVDYGVITFNPLLGHPQWADFNPDFIRLESISLIKNTINQGYEIFIFKEHTYFLEKPFFNFLVDEHNFILREYSESFCKLELLDDETIHNNLNLKSDASCL